MIKTITHLTSDLILETDILYGSMAIPPDKMVFIDRAVARIGANKDRYEAVSTTTGVPWYFIGIVHFNEGNLNFKTHLHNGDPLSAHTVNVPANRPVNGNPPFSWEESAEDALRFTGLDNWKHWTIAGLLNRFEAYNGSGYRSYGIHSPYLWNLSNHYKKGRFVADGHFWPNAMSKNIGAACLLYRMRSSGLITLAHDDLTDKIKTIGTSLRWGNAKQPGADQLQALLNASLDLSLKTDGIPGNNTSAAYKQLTGTYLAGDPRLASTLTAS